MAVKLVSTRDSAHLSGLKFLIHAPSGAGKTTLSSTTGESTIIISAESGLLSLSGFDIPAIEVKTLEELYEAYAFVADSEQGQQFSWVVLDSISEIAEVVLNAEKKTARDPRQAYGALAEKMTDLIRAFRDLPGRNVVFLCKQEKIKDEQSGAILYAPSMPGNMLKQGIAYFFDFVGALRVEKDGEGNPTRWIQFRRDFSFEAKDRSGVLEMFEPPNLRTIADKVLAAKHQA
jgi:hypothetical protein